MAAMKQRQRNQQCVQDNDCGCQNTKLPSRSAQPLLHMDECNDPNCIDYEQLQELQKSIDRFTDYDNYEKCCDGDHEEGEACDGNPPGLCCQDLTPSAEDCEECIDDCDECIEEHELSHINDFDAILDMGSPVKCDDDCVQCEEECEENGHERKDCPQNHHTSWESCITTCGVCVDPKPLPLLGPEAELQLYGLNSYIPHITPCDERCTPPPDLIVDFSLPDQSHLQPQPTFDVALDHWQTFQQAHHCAPDPCIVDPLPQLPPPQHIDPQFGFSFGCDPALPGNQYPWQHPSTPMQTCNVQSFEALDLDGLAGNMNDFTPVNFSFPEQSTNPGQVLNDINALNEAKVKPKANSPSPPAKTGKFCQWFMPCGSICGQTFARTDDLKRHVKNSHLCTKGTVTCRWGSACTASFATEAALTGHISKKHLAPLYAAGSATTSHADGKSPATSSVNTQAEELPWKCTFPACNKSFMYKQVRDDHVASHTGSNRAHCPICHQWLNSEGSNFRRHMASHRPENEHMKCKHQHLGCRRKFPRLDNLRRHEACCKYGKKAAAAEANGVHAHHGHGHGHHHHHHHAGH